MDDRRRRRGAASAGRVLGRGTGLRARTGFESEDNASIINPDGVGPAIGFLRVPEPKTAKNRLHLDIRVAGPPPRTAESEQRMRAKATALLAIGATVVRED